MDINPPNTFCSHCGNRFASAMPFPRRCQDCGATTWLNPRPVGVALVPLLGTGGVLLVRRAIAPIGLALPGGFMEAGQTWRENVARELREETGLDVPSSSLELLEAPGFCPLVDVGGGNLLVFALSPPVSVADVEATFAPGPEVSGWLIGVPGESLVFPMHQLALDAFLHY